ncbi:MAG: TonB-dependent receptor [Deltaproteobacteria bacterium]|jgi:outer membrane receptor protein involved in Fe transport|nr:TonB-dependent receptor [Deltaproteobacteria bacterium]MCL5880222.1 TonB-dependent receptor [Deltaproteobacteria bacterium]
MKLKVSDGKLRKIRLGIQLDREQLKLFLFIVISVFAVFYAPSKANAKVIVLKAEKKAKKVKRTPFTVSKIKKRAIDATKSPMNSIETILNQAPSIHASTSGPNNIRARVELRGFGTGEVAQTFDGVPINNMFDGDSSNYMDVRNNVPFTLGDISGVGIYYGVNNPSVDSFDSLGGTINYEPLMPTGKFSANIFGGYGSFATRTYGVGINTGKLWEGIRMYLKVSRDDANNWYNGSAYPNRLHSYYMSLIKPYNENRSHISFIFMRNDDYANDPHLVPVPLLDQFGYSWGWPTSVENAQAYNQEYYAILGWKAYINRDLNFDNKSFYFNENMAKNLYINPACHTSAASAGISTASCDIPSSIYINGVQPYALGFGSGNWSLTPVPTATYNPDPQFLDGQNSATAIANGFTPGFAYGTDNHYKAVDVTQFGDIPAVTIRVPRNTLTVGGQFLFGTYHKLESYYGEAYGPAAPFYNIANNQHGTENMDSVYAQDKLDIIPDKLFLEPGLKYQVVDMTVAANETWPSINPYGGTVSDTFTEIEPTIGLSYNLLPNWNFYATYGRTMKAPNYTAYESVLTSYNGTNFTTSLSGVKPEYVTDYELGTRYKLDNLELSANVYKEDFSNTFGTYLNTTTEITYETNGGRSQYEGLQLEGQYDFNRHLNVFANYSLNTGKFISNYSGPAGNVISGENVPFIPRHLANIGLDENYFNIDARLWGTYTGEQFVEDINGNPTSAFHLGGYWLFNLNLSRYFNFKRIGILKEADLKGMKLSLSIDNILDRKYLTGAIPGFVATYPNSNAIYAEYLPGMPRFVFLTSSFKF